MMSVPDVSSAFSSVPTPGGGPSGSVAGGVRVLLRLEGAAALAVAIALYAHGGFSWLLFVALFFAPDLAMLAYTLGPRAGAAAYNAAHTYVAPVALLFAGFAAGVPAAVAGALIWIGHIGFDRALGFGLKYPTGFRDTHLSRH